MGNPKLIQGGHFTDQRGTLVFVNEFCMSEVVRFYKITHPSTNTIRAWNGHKIEQKWFYCVNGSFVINLVKIDNWNVKHIDESALVQFRLSDTEPKILHIPGGYVNGFRALEKDSTLIVYSNMTVEQSRSDDFRFPPPSPELFV